MDSNKTIHITHISSTACGITTQYNKKV